MSEKIVFAANNVNGVSRIPFGKYKFTLQNINFELPYGYLMGIIGRNGAGKTTFFDYIMNRRKRYCGQFLLDGGEIHKNQIKTLDSIGFVSETNEFLERRTTMQNAEMLGRFYSAFDIELFKNTMEDFGLSTSKNVMAMSRGERMRFQLAFAIAHRPKLYLIDEATAGMDPVFRIEFYRTLKSLVAKESCSVILSTHIEEEIERQLDYIGVLENGRFVEFHENALT